MANRKGSTMSGVEKVGLQLRVLREGRGFSQLQTATAARIPQPVLSDLERGAAGRRLGRYAVRLARVLGRGVLDLAWPGQLQFSVDWTLAERRVDLDKAAKTWLRARARENLLHGIERVEVWKLPGMLLLVSLETAETPAR